MSGGHDRMADAMVACGAAATKADADALLAEIGLGMLGVNAFVKGPPGSDAPSIVMREFAVAVIAHAYRARMTDDGRRLADAIGGIFAAEHEAIMATLAASKGQPS